MIYNKTILHQELENWLNKHPENIDKLNSMSNENSFMISIDHEHYFDPHGFLVCPLCGEKMDTPFIAVVKNDIVESGEKIEETNDELSSRSKRTSKKDNDLHMLLGKREAKTDSNQRHNNRDGTHGINRDKDSSSSQGISQETIHQKVSRPNQPIIVRSVEEYLK